MKYMGSKSSIFKDIYPIIFKNINSETTFYDACCGGGNFIDKVPKHIKRIGIDINPYVIGALCLIRDNITSLPKNNEEFTIDDYKKYQYDTSLDIGMRGYVGFALSYGGKWFGGWCRDSKDKRDYVREAYNNATKQAALLQNCKFIVSDFMTMTYNHNSIIYIDPPYANTTTYKNIKFDYVYFWEWVRKMSINGYNIFVSSYEAPNDFECLFEKTICSSLTPNTGAKVGKEKLFKYTKHLTIKSGIL